MIPVSGSAYTYSYATLGEIIAWIIGWDLILEYALGASTVAVGWSGHFVSFLHDFLGITVPPAFAAAPCSFLPAAGRTSSCFGSRWGVAHLGVDIAAPIGTPIYAATSGVVERSGPATGFGLAVYLRGTNGVVTVYGHVNRAFVKAGDRVTVGQQIAEVGNRGQSTGPHLHFEVHPDGQLYSGAVDPAPWLRSPGVAFSGC